MILAIDPGSTESAYVVLDKNLKPIMFHKMENNLILDEMYRTIGDGRLQHFAIEMVASYGMAVGKEVFETCVWAGRFWEASLWIPNMQRIYRKDEKMNLCNSMKAKDGNIRQALIDRFGPVGVKKRPGWFYGVSKDVWSAIAVGVTYHDLYIKHKE
jgi:hypothetical protein